VFGVLGGDDCVVDPTGGPTLRRRMSRYLDKRQDDSPNLEAARSTARLLVTIEAFGSTPTKAPPAEIDERFLRVPPLFRSEGGDHAGR